MIMTEKRIPWYMHIIFLTKNFRQCCPLFEPDFYTKLDEKLVKSQTICWKVIANSKV